MRWILAVVLAVVLAGCTSSQVTARRIIEGVVAVEWEVKLDRLLTDTEFNRADVHIDPNGAVDITFYRFSAEQQAMELAEKALVIGAGVAAAATP